MFLINLKFCMKIDVIIKKIGVIILLLSLLISLPYAQTKTKIRFSFPAIFSQLRNLNSKHKNNFSDTGKKTSFFKHKVEKKKSKLFGFFAKKDKTNRLLQDKKFHKTIISKHNSQNTSNKPFPSNSQPSRPIYSPPHIRKLKMDPICSEQCVKLIHKCEKKYRIPKNLLHAISLVESGTSCKGYPPTMRCPWPWTIASSINGVSSMQFANKDEAKHFLRNLLYRRNKNVDVGCMQINVLYHRNGFTSIDELLEPKKNIEYAAKHLHSKYEKCKNWNKAVALYHSANEVHGKKYYAKVMEAKKEIAQHPMLIAKSKNSAVFLANRSTK